MEVETMELESMDGGDVGRMRWEVEEMDGGGRRWS